MFRTVAVAVPWGAAADGSDLAVAHGATLARQAGASLQLVTVTPSYVDPGAARRHLVAVAEAHSVDATPRLVEAGDPAVGLATVGSEPATLLCLRTHGHGLLAELTLGSVSAQVVRTCRRPVLLIGPRCGPAPTTYQSIVAALDTSALAETILPVVTQWCSHLDLQPWLFEVLPALAPFERGTDVEPATEGMYLHHVADQLGLDGVSFGWDTTHDRDVGSAIVRFATRHTPGIVALSTHGCAGLGHVVTGSVALAVAHRSTVPVLVRHPQHVPPERADAELGGVR